MTVLFAMEPSSIAKIWFLNRNNFFYAVCKSSALNTELNRPQNLQGMVLFVVLVPSVTLDILSV